MTHDGAMTMNLSGEATAYRVVCSCAWVGRWTENEDHADAEFVLHTELASMTADDFDVGGS